MKISTGTIARTIILALALINQILTSTGHSVIPIEDETIQNLVTLIFTVASALIGWWKNNSFTRNAIKADEMLSSLKKGGREN